MDSTNPSPASVFGEESARALRAAQRVWSAGTWALVLWVIGTPIVDEARTSFHMRVIAHAKAEEEEEEAATTSARPRIADLRAAVPQRIWIVSVTGAILLVLGVLLSIAAGAVGLVAATEPVAISPVALFASALVCYAIGYPMMLAFTRNVGSTNGKTGAGSR